MRSQPAQYVAHPQGSAMVASSQVTAVDAGLDILRGGGNAIDAAVAAAACLTVVEPCSNGIGGDCFALVWDGFQLHGLNASGRSPAGWVSERFEGKDEMPVSGWDSVTVPGQIAGWAAILERFGSKSLAECLAPSIDAAENGFIVTPTVAARWAEALETHGHRHAFAETFSVNGKPPETGSTCRLPDHGRTLRRIATSGGEDFYRGDLARAICNAAAEAGGCLSEADLAGCAAEWVKPLSLDACGVTGYEIPPNGQGIAALAACGVAECLGLDAFDLDDPQAVHLQIEAIKQAFSDLFTEVGDGDAMRLDPQELLAPDRLAARARLVDPNQAGKMNATLPNSPGTVLLTTADESGRMVSFIQSNFWGFGSGVVIPGTGIALQNRGCGFNLKPGHPNQVGPRKRPLHTIIPGFWMRNGRPLGPFGCMGGHMQAQGHLQIWQRMFRWGQSPQAAVDAKRWQLTQDGTVWLEEGFPKNIASKLRALGHATVTKPAPRFGGAQLILSMDGTGYVGATDPRKDGKVGVP